ncbi:MAG: hypothetical protein ACI9LN_003565 [Saprospiraceae bacterium]|jgi:hypothetical protein
MNFLKKNLTFEHNLEITSFLKYTEKINLIPQVTDYQFIIFVENFKA